MDESAPARWWEATAELYERALVSLTPEEFRAFMIERIGALRMMGSRVTCSEESVPATLAYLDAGNRYLRNVIEARPRRRKFVLPLAATLK